jgi:hypothetical protein
MTTPRTLSVCMLTLVICSSTALTGIVPPQGGLLVARAHADGTIEVLGKLLRE